MTDKPPFQQGFYIYSATLPKPKDKPDGIIKLKSVDLKEVKKEEIAPKTDNLTLGSDISNPNTNVLTLKTDNIKPEKTKD